MQLDTIELGNFKNFGLNSIQFNQGVNLFVGINGSGKTSLLEAINVAMGGFFGSQEQKMQRVIAFDEIKITRGRREATTHVAASSAVVNGSWTRTIRRDSKTNDTKGTKLVSDYGKHFFDAFEDFEDKTIAPLIAYYSSQRLFKDSSLSGKQKYDAAAGRRNGYLQCLGENAIKPVLNEWLANAVTKRATMYIKGIASEDLVLANVEEVIRYTLIKFLNLSPDFPLKIYQDPDFNNELFLQFDEEHPLPMSHYSDGFRNLLYLVIDLMWRASQLNPWLPIEAIKENIVGVVTIDEIDLHLHPTWQAMAIDLLQELFPKVQFFITTHSPTVVANFQGGTLFTIDSSHVTRINGHYFGKEVNAVLRDFLGSPDRHRATQKKIDLLLNKIDENIADANIAHLLTELTTLLGKEDRDIQRAKSLIHLKQVKNENPDAVH